MKLSKETEKVLQELIMIYEENSGDLYITYEDVRLSKCHNYEFALNRLKKFGFLDEYKSDILGNVKIVLS